MSKAHSFSLVFACLLASLVIYLIMWYLCRQRLTAKDERIRTYQQKLGILPASNEKSAHLDNFGLLLKTRAQLGQHIQLLTQHIDDGQALIQRSRTEKELVSASDVEAWAKQAEESIERIFDTSYVYRFRSSVGVPMTATYRPNLENRNVDGFCYVRVYRLREFADELRARHANVVTALAKVKN